MAIPEHRRRAFILPEQLTGHPLRSICFDIPDVAEYRQAFWGHIWKLGENFVWEKDSNADIRDVQAAEYWRQVLSENYTRWLNEESCDDDSCRSYPPNAPFIQWFPNDPYLSPDFVGEGYNAPAWYIATTASNIAYGSSPGDIITSLDRFPPGSLPSIIPASGLPRFRINVNGEGTVKATLTNLFGGSLIQTTVDDNILSAKFVDVSRDTLSVPPETQSDLTVEFEFTTPGHHHIDFIVISWANSSIPFLHHGGGLRKVELCGFATMPVVSPPFRFTAECGLEYYNGEEWLPVEGWDDFAPTCFTGPPGEDATPLYLEETELGLVRDDNPEFSTPTLIYAYYRADATRRATAFLAQGDTSRLVLYNSLAVQKLFIGLIGTNNEIDTRESKLLLRFGIGATNTRLMHFNGDGTIQIVNSAIAAAAKFEVYNDVSALHGVRIEGRTGQATGTAVLHLGAVNQESAGTDGDAIFVRGLNSVTATRATGMFVVDKHGRVLNADSHRLQVLTDGTTPKTYRNAGIKVASLLDMAGTNYRSRITEFGYKDGSSVETFRHEITADNEAAIGVLGHSASPRIELSGDAMGNQLVLDIAQALDAFGWVDASAVSLGELPEPPEPTTCELDRCGYAHVTAGWFATQVFAVAAWWAGHYEEFMFQSERFDKIIANADVHFANHDTLGDWVNEIYLAYGAFDASDADIELFIEEAQTYIKAEIKPKLYCYMSECGYMTSATWDLFIDSLADGAGVEHWVRDLFRSLDRFGLAAITALASRSSYVDGITNDCEEIDCDFWQVDMNFMLDDWSGSITLDDGVYEPPYENEAPLRCSVAISIDSHITSAEVTVNVGHATHINYHDTGGITHDTRPVPVGTHTFLFVIDSPDGAEIVLGSTPCEDGELYTAQIRRVIWTGKGTAPTP